MLPRGSVVWRRLLLNSCITALQVSLLKPFAWAKSTITSTPAGAAASTVIARQATTRAWHCCVRRMRLAGRRQGGCAKLCVACARTRVVGLATCACSPQRHRDRRSMMQSRRGCIYMRKQSITGKVTATRGGADFGTNSARGCRFCTNA